MGNTIIFYVNQKANKQQIKAAFKEAFSAMPQRVNIMNTVLGRKKVFIKLPKSNEVSEIANKIGLLYSCIFIILRGFIFTIFSPSKL